MRTAGLGTLGVLGAVGVLLILAVQPAQAFGSAGKRDSPHDDITAVAGDLGWPEDAVDALQESVRQADISDFDEEKADGKKRLAVTPVFDPAHHCDRVPPATDEEAFNATVAYIAWERGVAENLSMVDPEAAMRALGRALHAVQDCFSHSNIVDLDPLAQGRSEASLLKGDPMPEGLMLGGSDPSVPEIGRPPGDAYAHDERNKDSPGSSPESDMVLPDGRTKHEAALALARGATREFLLEFQERLGADEMARLYGVEEDAGKSKSHGLPALGLGWAAPLLMLAAVAARRRAR